MIELKFIPWRKFQAFKDNAAIQAYLQEVGVQSIRAFLRGMHAPKTGRTYNRSGRIHIASSPGDYPAIDSGLLASSVGADVGAMRVTVGTNTGYAGYLATGTSRMSWRKMSSHALHEGIANSKWGRSFAGWRLV